MIPASSAVSTLPRSSAAFSGLIASAILSAFAVAGYAQRGGLGSEARFHRDLSYVENGHERHRLDLYLPDESAEGVPLIIWIHGGGWQNGSKENALPVRQGWTERGYAVASLNYRLSGHAIFPAQIEDCKAAVRWLRANADQYGLDPDRFGVWGSSAGGHLAALVGTSGNIDSFDIGGNLDQSGRVQAVCSYFGPTDFAAFVATPGYESHARPDSPEGRLLGGAVRDRLELAARANPIIYVDEEAPPFLIVHGDLDPVVPIQQSELLYEALREAGGGPRFHTVRGAGHGRGFEGPEILPMVREFFDFHLRSSGASGEREARTSESEAPERRMGPGDGAPSGGGKGKGKGKMTPGAERPAP